MLRALGGSAAVLAWPSSGAVRSAPKQRPNVVVIMADDLGWGEISCHGAPTPTPHIDRCFAEGLELGSHMVMPVCSPTRAGFLTGRHPARVGIAPTTVNADVGCTMPGEEVTIAEAFSAAGYATACLGKWHLGYVPSPNQQGFDLTYGNMGAAVDYFTRMTGRDYYDWYLNGEKIEEEGYTTDLIGNRAVRYIEESDQKPFFLYLPFTAVHNPLQATKAYLKRVVPEITEENKRTHAAMTIALDDAVGRILAALDEKGIADNTIVLFISDNGGIPSGSNLPFRGGKHTLYDGGVRTPAAIRWPGHIQGGRRTDELLGVEDLFPTLLALTGVPRPQGVKFDGFDASRVLLEGASSPRESYCWIWTNHDSIRTRRWKLLRWRDRKELYDLDTDPAESNNLVDQRPEVARQLEAKLDAWEASIQCYPSHIPAKRDRPAKAAPEGDVLEVRIKRRAGRRAAPLQFTLAAADLFQLNPGDRLEYDMLVARGSTEGGFFVDVLRGPLPQWVYDMQPHRKTGEPGGQSDADNKDVLARKARRPKRRVRSRKRKSAFSRCQVVDQYGVLQSAAPGFAQARGRWARRVLGLANLCPTMLSQVSIAFDGKPEAQYLIYLDNIIIRRRNGQTVEFYRNGDPKGLSVPKSAAYEDISVRVVPISEYKNAINEGIAKKGKEVIRR